jgi:23S rRNA (guanosine2251-2'-O)-methyltransferase
MAGQSRKRGSRRRQLTASHQRNWLVGRYAVQETMKAGRWPVTELYVSSQLPQPEWNDIVTLAEEVDCIPQTVDEDRLTQLCGSSHHQGMAARMGEFPYLSWPQLIQQTEQRTADPSQLPSLIVLCDRIQDAFNFGAILRCCDAMAVDAVVIGSAEQAVVTPHVARSSSGAVNHLQIARIDSLVEAAQHFKAQGYHLMAATEKGAMAPASADLVRPGVLMIGSEARGLSEQLLDLSDVRLAIPMLGQVESLNAAVAAGILLYEIRRQQQNPSSGS